MSVKKVVCTKHGPLAPFFGIQYQNIELNRSLRAGQNPLVVSATEDKQNPTKLSLGPTVILVLPGAQAPASPRALDRWCRGRHGKPNELGMGCPSLSATRRPRAPYVSGGVPGSVTAGNSAGGWSPPTPRADKARSCRPPSSGVFGSLGVPLAQGGVSGRGSARVPPPAAAAEPRGLLEQTRTVLVPVYGSGCPEFLATMRDTVTAPGLSGEASGCGGVVDTTGGCEGAQWGAQWAAGGAGGTSGIPV